METYSNEVLKALIDQSGLKQSFLAYGICDTAHLSNVLNGKRKLSGKLFEDLLWRMGLNPIDYLHITNTANLERVCKLARLRFLVREETEQAQAECELLVQELEPHLYTFATRHAQQLLNIKANLLFAKGDYKAVRDTAKRGLMLTRALLFPAACEPGVPKLKTLLDELPYLVLSVEEGGLFVRLATGYGADATVSMLARNRLHIAHDILTALWQSLEQLPDHNHELTTLKIVALRNYTKSLYMLGEHAHALALCDRGEELCRRFWNGHQLPVFIAAKADNLIKLGQTQAAIPCLRKACLLFEGTGQIRELQIYQDVYADLLRES